MTNMWAYIPGQAVFGTGFCEYLNKDIGNNTFL